MIDVLLKLSCGIPGLFLCVRAWRYNKWMDREGI